MGRMTINIQNVGFRISFKRFEQSTRQLSKTSPKLFWGFGYTNENLTYRCLLACDSLYLLDGIFIFQDNHRSD